MASEKRRILATYYRKAYGSGPLLFDEVLADVATTALGLSRVESEHYSQRNAARHWNWLLEQLDADRTRGVEPVFNILDASSRRLIWHPYHAVRDYSPRQLLRLRRLRSRPSILNKIDALNDREYEALGCVACKLLGASQVRLTPPSNEGGIDFFAVLTLPRFSHVFFGGNPLRIVGQSKKYATPVQDDRMKEFIFTLEDVRRRSPRVLEHLPSWFLAATGPVVGWMIAHSGFQSGAISRAHHHGVTISDSRDITEIASLSRRVKPLGEPSERVSVLYSIVRDFVDGMTTS